MYNLMATDLGKEPSELSRSATKIAEYIVLIILWLALSIIAGYRLLGIGRDYLEYLSFYHSMTSFFSYGYSRFEIGFEITAWVFGSILRLPYEVFATFLVSLSLAIKFYLFKKYLGSPWLAILAYIMIFYPTHEYTQIRAAVAISLGYLAVHFLMTKKRFVFIILSALAVTFHSGVLILPILALSISIISKNAYKYIIVIIPIFMFAFYSIILRQILPLFVDINPLISNYIENKYGALEANLFSGSNILFAISLIIVIALGNWKDELYYRIFIFFVVVAFSWLALFQDSPVIALRTAYILFVGVIFYSYRERLSYRSVYLQLVVILAGCWSFYRAIEEGIILE